jgi:integral membrane protein (TIGR00529 family)
LGLLFGLDAMRWPLVAARALTQDKAVFLAAIVGLILVLSEVLEASGLTTRLMDALAGYLRHPRLRLVFFPALIGLLPMPGGAVFSAPMLGSVANDMEMDPVDKVALNYWFRHVWELFWPLYPGIILTSSLAGVPLYRLVIHGLPGSVACVILGWWFLLRPGVLSLPRNAYVGHNSGRERLSRTLCYGAPLLVAIAGALILEGLIAWQKPHWPFEAGVVVALAAAIVVGAVQGRVSAPRLAGFFISRHVFRMLWVIAAIFVFKDVMGEAGVIHELSEVAGTGMALFASAVFLPFLVGMVSGITIAFVGAAFPLLLGLMSQPGLQEQMMAYLILGLIAGFSGVLLSPIHICFILSCEYFKVKIARAWRRILAPGVGLMVFGTVYFLILRAV